MKPSVNTEKSFKKVGNNYFIMRKVQTIEYAFNLQEAQNTIKQLKRREEQLNAELERIQTERKDLENAIKEKAPNSN